MKVSHIEHLGIAVKSLDESIPYWENVLGLKCYAIEEVADQKVRTAFFKLGQTKIELLEPTSPESTIAKFIDTRGPGLQQLAYRTSDIEALSERLRADGVRLLYEAPRRGTADSRINFIHPKDAGGVLIELVEPAKDAAH